MNEVLIRLLILREQRERGQTMAEYAVTLGIISVTILLALGALRGSISGALGKVTSDV